MEQNRIPSEENLSDIIETVKRLIEQIDEKIKKRSMRYFEQREIITC